MRRFQFPLGRLKKLREYEAEQQRLLLQKLLAEQAELEQAIRACQDELEATRQVLLKPATFEAQEIHELGQYRRYLRETLQQLEKRAEALSVEVEKQRARWLESRRRLQILERFEDRKFQSWKLEWERQSSREADEQFLARFRR